MTDNFIKFNADDETFFFVQTIEVKEESEDKSPFLKASSKTNTVFFSKAVGGIKYIAKSFVESIKMMAEPPDEITLETSFTFSKGGNLIFLKGDVESAFKVTIKWKSKKT